MRFKRHKKEPGSEKPAPEFELTAPRTAEAEKRIASGTKNLDLYFKINGRSKAELAGSTFLIGNELNELADLMPHGELEAFIDDRYKLPKSTQQRWRETAKAVIQTLQSKDGKSTTVGLLKGKALILSGKKKFNEKERRAILELVPKVIGAKGITQFTRDVFGLQAKAAGGFRPNAAMLEAWLRADTRYRDLAGKSFDELPPDVQEEFRKQYKHPAPDAEEIAEMERESWRDHLQWLGTSVAEKTYVHLADNLKEFEQLQKILHDANQAFLGLMAKAKTQPNTKRRAKTPAVTGGTPVPPAPL